MESLLIPKANKQEDNKQTKTKKTTKKVKKDTDMTSNETKEDDNIVKEIIASYEDANKTLQEKIEANKKIIEALKWKSDQEVILEERKRIVTKIIKLIEKGQKVKAMKLKLRLDVFDIYFSIQKTTLDDFNNIVNNIV